MGKRYRLVVFDWEGTLGDTLGQILNTVDTEARRLGFGGLDTQLARQSLELGLVMALKKVFPHLSESQQEHLQQAVQHALAGRTADVYLIPGAREIVGRLKREDVALAIASNKGQQSLQRVLHASKLDELFAVTRSAGQTPPKPCPQMLEEIMAEFGVEPGETLMVGDSVSDIEMAKSIGIDAVAVDFYHQQESILRAAGALEVFDEYNQLAGYLHLPDETGGDPSE